MTALTAADGMVDPVAAAIKQLQNPIVPVGQVSGFVPGVRGVTTGNRAVCIGDSVLGMGVNQGTQVPTSAGSLVVSGGIATINMGGNSYTGPAGNYVQIYNQYDPANFSLSFNGVCTPILSQVGTNSAIFTISANFPGLPACPNGDYSAGYAGNAWSVGVLTYGTDSGPFFFLNARAGNPFRLVASYGLTGATAFQVYTLMKQGKILNGPNFETAFVGGFGINEANNVSSLASAIAAVSAGFYWVTQIVSMLLAAGKKVVLVPDNPVPTGATTYPSNVNAAVAYLHSLYINYAERVGLPLIDLYAYALKGNDTSTKGCMIAAYQHTSSDVHLGANGLYTIAGSSLSTTFQALAPNYERGAISPGDDGITLSQGIAAWAASTSYSVGNVVSNYPNVYICLSAGTSAASGGPTGTGSSIADGTGGLVWGFLSVDSRNLIQNGTMAGTAGSNATSGAVTGTVPTGWTLFGASNVSGTSASAQTRNGSAPQSNWGFGWNIAATFSAAGTLYLLNTDFSSVISGKGGWFETGITLSYISAFTNIAYISPTILIQDVAGKVYQTVTMNWPGNNTTNFAMVSGDNNIEFRSNPFYIDGLALTTAQMKFAIVSVAAGGCGVQFSNAYCRAIANPYG